MSYKDELDRLVREATTAYERARKHVYDLEHGVGPHQRTPYQEQLVEAQEQAEQALKQFREAQAQARRNDPRDEPETR